MITNVTTCENCGIERRTSMEKKDKVWATMMHVLFLAAFSSTCIFLYRMCTYGNLLLHIPILVVSLLVIISYIIWVIARKASKKQVFVHKEVILPYLVVIFIAGVSSVFAAICSLSDPNGVFQKFLDCRGTTKEIRISAHNIYTEGLYGIFDEIEGKLGISDELYVEKDCQIFFQEDGEIYALKTTLYGKTEKGKIKKYGFDYNSRESQKLTVTIKGAAGLVCSEDRRLSPFVADVSMMNVKNEIKEWSGQSEFSLIYKGKHNIGNDVTDLYYLRGDGTVAPASSTENQIDDYVVTLFVPETETVNMQKRYIQKEESEEPQQQPDVTDGRIAAEYMIDEQLGFQLRIVDAATGTYYYSLFKTKDGGNTYQEFNDNPFLGEGGKVNGMVFLDKKVGFLSLANSSGEKGMLYRTEDGGISFKQIMIQSEEDMEVFDLPGMPKLVNGVLQINVSQGSDGDYNGGTEALYESEDEGRTWTFIKEVPAS